MKRGLAWITWVSARPRAVLAALVAFYAIFGLCLLAPEAIYSGDIGVKYVQARALADHRFTSLSIPYPGEFLDPDRAFFPLRPPFVMTASGSTQSIFSPMAAVFQGLAVATAGLRGLILMSIAAAGAVLYSAWKLAPARCAVAVLIALGLGGPLWFHAVAGWEHAPGVAFGAAGFLCAVRSRARAAPLLAGVLVGAGAVLRDEVLLLLPGVLFVLWCRDRSVRTLASAAGGVLIPLAVSAAVEVWWFERPVAAHLRHAVHLVQAAIRVADGPNPDVPVLVPLTPGDRYNTVVEYWLLGYGNDRVITAIGAGLLVALAVRRRWRSSLALFLWLTVIVAFAAADLWELVLAPKWLAGLHRVSPYLVFALLPRPEGPREADDYPWLRKAIGLTAAIYLFIAFVGADTTGGKALGPRLLLPLFPLLTVSALMAIRAYLSAPAVADRWVGGAGALLVVMSVAMHLFGTIPAYYARNADDFKTVRAIAETGERVIVADDEFTAQLLLPLYYRRIVLLADKIELGPRLGARLAEARLPKLIVVTRWADTPIDLAPFEKRRTQRYGRMTIQIWER